MRPDRKIGDYLFNLHGVGTDNYNYSAISLSPCTWRGFQFDRAAPGSLTTGRASVSGAVAFQASAAGTFNQTVALSCRRMPAGVVCTFQPSSAPISSGSRAA